MTYISTKPSTDVGPERKPKDECFSLDAILFWTQRKKFLSPWRQKQVSKEIISLPVTVGV